MQVTNLWTVAASGERTAGPFLKTAFHKTAARFSPDGRWVAYTSNESGRSHVYVTSFPKADFRRQISTDGGEKPEWRRDGRELFFVSTDGRLMASDVSREDWLDDRAAAPALRPSGEYVRSAGSMAVGLRGRGPRRAILDQHAARRGTAADQCGVQLDVAADRTLNQSMSSIDSNSPSTNRRPARSPAARAGRFCRTRSLST